MNHSLSPVIALPVAGIVALFALATWFVLVRPVPEMRATGVITGRELLESERVSRTVPRFSRSIEHMPRTTEYTVPDRYRYTVRLDSEDREVTFSQPSTGGEPMNVGDRVRVTYFERKLPLLFHKLFVKELKRES